jgi:Fic family protein
MSPYVTRNGRRIEVEILETGVVPKKRRKLFEAQWVKLPRHWVVALRRSNSVSTIHLAHAILFKAFESLQKHETEIVLSSVTTGMSRNTKTRAVKELVDLGLIKTERKGRGAIRVPLSVFSFLLL